MSRSYAQHHYQLPRPRVLRIDEGATRLVRARERYLRLSWPLKIMRRAWLTAWLLFAVLPIAAIYATMGCISLAALGEQMVRAGVKLQKYGY